MKMQINKEELKREWVMNKWYEKVAYVTGILMWIFWVIAIIIGFVEAI